MTRYFIHNETKFVGGNFKGIDSECTNIVAATIDPSIQFAKADELLKNFTEIDECDFLDMKDAGARQLWLAGSVRFFGFL